MKQRILMLLGAIMVFEAQIIVLDFFSKPIQAELDINPLHGISAIGFILSWTTGINATVGLLLAFISLLILPCLFWLLCNGVIQRPRRR